MNETIHIKKPLRVYDLSDPIDRVIADLRNVPIATIDLEPELQKFLDGTACAAADLLEKMKD